MPDIYKKILDLYESYQTLEIRDLALPTFAGLWLLTLLIPLTGINRKDLAPAVSYVIYLMGAAVVFFFILPNEYVKLDVTTTSQVLTLLSLAIVSAARWWFRKDTEVPPDILFEATISEEISE